MAESKEMLETLYGGDPFGGTTDGEAYDDFDAVIGSEADGGGYILLTPGIYPFTVNKPVDRERFNGSNSLPPCWKATVTLTVDGGAQGTTRVQHNLYLVKSQSWKIKQLFVGLGLVPDQDGIEFKPPWNDIVGTSGRVEIGNHVYQNKTFNDVKRILPASAPQATTQPVMNFPGA